MQAALRLSKLPVDHPCNDPAAEARGAAEAAIEEEEDAVDFEAEAHREWSERRARDPNGAVVIYEVRRAILGLESAILGLWSSSTRCDAPY